MRTRFVAVLATTALSVWLPTTPANAVDCVAEQQLLTAFNATNYNATGSFNKNMVREANIDAGCQSSSHAMRASTAFVQDIFATFVKVGWYERWGLNPPQHLWYAFWEVGVGQTLEALTSLPLGGYGNWAQFKVMNIGNDDWQFSYDSNSDGVYEWVDPPGGYQVIGMSNGNARSQTARRGGGSAYDHFTNLKYRGSDGIWRSWLAVIQVYDDIAGYHCHKDAATQYQVHMPNTSHTPGTANYCG